MVRAGRFSGNTSQPTATFSFFRDDCTPAVTVRRNSSFGTSHILMTRASSSTNAQNRKHANTWRELDDGFPPKKNLNGKNPTMCSGQQTPSEFPKFFVQGKVGVPKNIEIRKFGNQNFQIDFILS